ncbi:hypothetical protein GF312_02525, partial [Candidatus Poribacteria bacterium]|nr:hypothetical protein [Candidatus Poribacteria bacterium]
VYMVECIQAGAHGCVPSIGNVVPEICAKLYDAIIDGNDEKIEILKKQMLDARKRVYTSGKSWFSYVSGIKSKLNEKGITGTKMAEPFVME